MRVLYGPIDSWRFGQSLGVDPLAARAKKCPFSCVYCQYGQTIRPTLRRGRFVSAQRLEAEARSLAETHIDCVTFAGLGEPTLASNLPELVATARELFGRPVIVLTGGGLLPRLDVRRDLQVFDQVVAKLDAPDEALFEQINRPASGYPYSLQAIVDGIRRLREGHAGRLVLQIMLLKANLSAAPQLAELARSLIPDEVQLNTPLQPALGGPISASEMERVEPLFAGMGTVRSVYSAGQAKIKPRLM
jgi:wyosine [tRNA(Phe)-imidazoG37] synthetase (radical SAM superfamily)